ncbi:hypothetical protein B7H23_13855 [Notoacmeibacter marinus]|uniref:Uncharacterized protein n=1 Tax=Notoacmeibacter marinus TaxID=1876515 RepID=A0A231UTK9_9HYPH|nr:hypothetical protein [Notoacmeibacter marinus]OXS99262.1 hypothetical protein B7H23_13855 [Notoacmeibacter marinus]
MAAMQRGWHAISLTVWFIAAALTASVAIFPAMADHVGHKPCDITPARCNSVSGSELAEMNGARSKRARIRLDSLSRGRIERAAKGYPSAPVEIIEMTELPAPKPTPPPAAIARKPEPIWRELPDGPIRAVGPVFFPDREARQGLRVPGPSGDR